MDAASVDIGECRVLEIEYLIREREGESEKQFPIVATGAANRSCCHCRLATLQPCNQLKQVVKTQAKLLYFLYFFASFLLCVAEFPQKVENGGELVARNDWAMIGIAKCKVLKLDSIE